MWQYYNPNPVARTVEDCGIRAIAAALDLDWETAFWKLADAAYDMADVQTSKATLNAVLRKHGFYRRAIPDTCPDCYTAEDFCREYPEGVYVLAFGSHVAAVRDGCLLDSWDSQREIPLFYWYRKER